MSSYEHGFEDGTYRKGQLPDLTGKEQSDLGYEDFLQTDCDFYPYIIGFYDAYDGGNYE